MMTDFTVIKKPFSKIGSRYTKEQYSSKGKVVVNNVEVVGHLLCDLTNFNEFYEWFPEITDSNPCAQ